jgi:SanA protein
MNSRIKTYAGYSLVVCAFLFVLAFGINAFIVYAASDSIYESSADVPAKQAALVLGARVYDSGAVSPILEDRLQAALELYGAEKIEKLIVSGDHGREEYDEVRSMRDWLINEGVPAEDIFMDHAGFDTYDSVYRARDVFEAESIIIVTQRFHLPRAIFIADALGLETAGVVADKREYSAASMRRNALREPLARLKALGSILVGAKPTYLGETIPVTGDGRVTDDLLN